MSNSPHLSLPYLASAQAQKHVTVNEALSRLDGFTNIYVESAGLVTPPPEPAEGDRYIVAPLATGAWLGREGHVAAFSNGAWIFAAPQNGWRAWVRDQHSTAVFCDGGWVAGLLGASDLGAATTGHLKTAEVVVAGPGPIVTPLTIPDRAVVLGVTARVTSAISGAGLTGWRMGVDGFDDRYGSGIGLAKDSVAIGVTGSPVGYFADTPVSVSPQGGAFESGAIRLAAHFLALTAPNEI